MILLLTILKQEEVMLSGCIWKALDLTNKPSQMNYSTITFNIKHLTYNL